MTSKYAEGIGNVSSVRAKPQASRRPGTARRISARNMPEGQPAGNRSGIVAGGQGQLGTRYQSKMAVARPIGEDGLALGIDEPDAFARFDPPDPCDRQVQQRR